MSDLKLNIGCGHTRLPGWVNCDQIAHSDADVVFDVQQRWPFEDNTVTEVYASHVIEHLDHPQQFFDEAWRVLKPHASLWIRTPHGQCRDAWTDFGHKRPWFAESFGCLQPGYSQQVRNPESAQFKPYAIHSLWLRVGASVAPFLRFRLIRRYLPELSFYLSNIVHEIWAHLSPLKDDPAVAAYRAMHNPQGVAATFIVYEHEYRRQPTPSSNRPVVLSVEAL
jgi:SAM-dependent methyltransferase